MYYDPKEEQRTIPCRIRIRIISQKLSHKVQYRQNHGNHSQFTTTSYPTTFESVFCFLHAFQVTMFVHLQGDTRNHVGFPYYYTLPSHQPAALDAVASSLLAAVLVSCK